LNEKLIAGLKERTGSAVENVQAAFMLALCGRQTHNKAHFDWPMSTKGYMCLRKLVFEFAYNVMKGNVCIIALKIKCPSYFRF